MEIYIEEVIIENFIFSYVVCSATSFALKQKLSIAKKTISSIIAIVLSVVSAYLNLNNLLFLFYKFLCVHTICYITFFAKSLKFQLINFVAYVFFGLVFGAALMLLSLSIYGTSQNTISIYTIVCILLVSCKIIKSIIKTFLIKSKIEQFTYSIKLKNGEKTITTSAFLDTGNFVVDPVTQKPVILVNFNLTNKLCGLKLEDIILKKYNCLKNQHSIEISTANKKSKIIVFEIDSVVINCSNQQIVINNAILGLCLAKLTATTCDALISSDVLSCA